ncbi:MAG: alpha-glucan family phosphorylase [Pirellulales bacterium]|nr:alpha-glucan family phosphorylase [Pirellulales bacterium]
MANGSGRLAPPRLNELSPQNLYDKCMALARNLWWSWHPEVNNLFRELDPVRFRQLGHNPIALLAEFTPERLESRAAELVLYSRINQAFRRLKEYLAAESTWSHVHAGVLGSKPVVYFSAEFGIHESVPVYSGGLGVLAGDHIKSASGLGIPLIAVGLFYKQGYFRQELDIDGYQHQEYILSREENLPIAPALDVNDKPVMVQVDTRSGPIFAQVWRMSVGRVNLYLLDSDVEGNKPEDRELTSRLYGGDTRIRIRQELVLGIGGVKAIRAMGITPGVYHLNEGHSAFATLEAIRGRMDRDGWSYDEAVRRVSRQTVFTTHTPVPAGHDRFDGGLIEEHLGPMRDAIGISHDHLMSLGRVEPHNHEEPFCMTVLALKLSQRANAVSALHGHVSRRMWNSLWPSRGEEEVPIGHITNGVHVPSWLSWQMLQLYDRIFPAGWFRRMGEPDVWQKIYDVDSGELWETHYALKNLLLQFVRRRLARQCRRRGECDEAVEQARTVLDPNVLTIGFARRFATYKRADLVLSDIDRLLAMISDPDRPIQIIFAGKAHPADEPGKALIRKIANLRHDERTSGRIVFVEDYDINVCRHLIQGVDIWLNNPRRPLEASGTSGQKVVLNGGLNCSILDGWWAEAFDGRNGFAIGRGETHAQDEITDQRDAAALYDVLEKEAIPLFYDRDSDGLPREWIRMMKNSISSLAWRFSAHRMVMDYARACYVPAAGGVSCDMASR